MLKMSLITTVLKYNVLGESVPTKKWEMQTSDVEYLLTQIRFVGILKRRAWLLASECYITFLWYVNKISGTNEQRVNFSSKFLQNVGLDKVVHSCKPNFHWTTILAAQLIEIHVWPVCNIVISCNTIFCCKVTNTKRIWRYLNN